jgi:hypothetical protein
MNKISASTFVLILVIASGAIVSPSRALTLFDGSLNTAPDAQGWLTYFAANGSPTISVTSGELNFDTTLSSSEVATYTNHQPTVAGNPLVNSAYPAMPRSGSGTTLRLDIQVLDESHTNTNSTAGFSWTVIADDGWGFELDFWKDRIWGAGPPHTFGESAAWDSTSGLIQYDVSFSGDTYTLMTNGSTLLTGPLRDYRSFNLQNVVSIGDNTGSAGAKVAISRLEIVPEPGSAGVLLSGVGFWVCLRRLRLRESIGLRWK